MNKKISELFAAYDGELELDEQSGFDPERIKANTLQKIRGERDIPVRKPFRRTLLIAAVLVCLLAATACAVVWQMSYRFLDEGETLEYSYTTDNLISKDEEGYHYEEKSIVMENAVMVLNFEGRSESKQFLLKANWLPEEYEANKISYAEYIAFYADHQRTPREYGPEPEAALKEAGLTEEEAKEWCFMFDCDAKIDGEMKPLYEITILQPTEIYQKDCLIGPYGDEAEIIKEGELSGWRMLEVYNKWRPQAGGETFNMDQNILLLYEPEKGYLITLVGTADFALLEKIAENLEVRETQRTIYSAEENWFDYNLIIAGVG
ncbi:MAG: hypothetical protein MSA25_05280 [Clostridiales bacterium]|nr:hypothetical protein [Clostridiales bacterium]